MSSDNIKLLSYTEDVILAGATVVTEKAILGQYISLNMTPVSDQELLVLIKFSGDGKNWDYSVRTTVQVGSNDIISTPAQAKWAQIEITNLGLVPTTYVRAIVYGTPSNSTITAVISKIGNFNPSVTVDNFPPSFANPNVRRSYVFEENNTSLASANLIYSSYYDLKVTHTGASALSTISNTNQCIVLSATAAGDQDDILGDTYPMNGNTFLVRFGAFWTYDLVSDLGGTVIAGASSSNDDKYGFGFNGALTYATWGIFTQTTGGVVFIPRTSFNVDPCDGTYKIATLDLTKLNSFQILFTPSSVDFYVMYLNEYLLVHKVYFNNSSAYSQFKDQSLGVWLRTSTNIAAIISSGSIKIHCSNWSITELGGSSINSDLTGYSSFLDIVSFTTTETPVLSVLNSTTFPYGASSIVRSVWLKNIIVTKATGADPIIVRVRLNPTLSVATSSTMSSYSNLKSSFGGTVSTPGVILYSRALITGSETTLILPDSILMNSGDLISITCLSATIASVYVSINFF